MFQNEKVKEEQKYQAPRQFSQNVAARGSVSVNRDPIFIELDSILLTGTADELIKFMKRGSIYNRIIKAYKDSNNYNALATILINRDLSKPEFIQNALNLVNILLDEGFDVERRLPHHLVLQEDKQQSNNVLNDESDLLKRKYHLDIAASKLFVCLSSSYIKNEISDIINLFAS